MTAAVPPVDPAPSATAGARRSGRALAPGAWLGVLGGGQLGRMFVHAAQAHGYRVLVLDPDPSSPAGAAADRQLTAAYDDADALAAMAARCSAVTTEFENVPAASLERLAAVLPTRPAAASVRVCQHRAREKAALVAAGVPTAPYAVLETASGAVDAETGAVEGGGGGRSGRDDRVESHEGAAAGGAHDRRSTPEDHGRSLLPGILKTATLGYDGKGQRAVDTPAALGEAWAALGRVPCVLEQRLALALELSVVVARGADGSCVHLPPQQNLHRDGVLAVTQVPGPGIDTATAAAAVAHARRLAAALDHVGVLCVEFFVLDDGRLVANEMAPRPHNSGHWSIDGCDVSQFDLQLRALAGLPLVAPRAHSAAVMLNLMGELWRPGADGAPRMPDWAPLLALPGVHLHLYGKAEARAGRKMGHLTVTADTAEAARTVALQAAGQLGLPAF